MQRKNTAATIITIIVAALAITTSLFLLYKMSENHTESDYAGYYPTEELRDEMTNNATTLIGNNYEVFKLFLYRGLPFQEEPYGNKPEDGLYEVKSDTYKTMSDIEELVKNTFVEKEANRILTDVNDNGAVFAEKTLVDGEKVLGIRSDLIDSYNHFIGIEYYYTWENAQFDIKPISNTECDIRIILTSTDPANSTEDVTGEIKTTMLKVNGKWLLQKLTY